MALLPSLKSLQCFVTVVQSGRFIRAAELLHMSNSAVSQQIKTLEQFMGRALLVRTAHDIQLTDVGQAFYNEASAALSALEPSVARHRAVHDANLVNLYIASSLAIKWLIPHLVDLQSRYPKIDLRFATNLLPTQTIAQFDLAIDLFALGSEPAGSTLLWSDDLILVGSPKLVQPGADVQQLLSEHPCIKVGASLRKDDWHVWAKHFKLRLPAKRQFLLMHNSIQALEAAKAGAGLLLTHYPLARYDIEAGTLAEVKSSRLSLGRSYFLIQSSKHVGAVTTVAKWLMGRAI